MNRWFEGKLTDGASLFAALIGLYCLSKVLMDGSLIALGVATLAFIYIRLGGILIELRNGGKRNYGGP